MQGIAPEVSIPVNNVRTNISYTEPAMAGPSAETSSLVLENHNEKPSPHFWVENGSERIEREPAKPERDPTTVSKQNPYGKGIFPKCKEKDVPPLGHRECPQLQAAGSCQQWDGLLPNLEFGEHAIPFEQTCRRHIENST